ncbi:four helix bundle protein [Flavobacteriaceae bacterium 3-367]|uniref:four helix bundle protein n=1 Tax=Eudoraea algarum TaxID=3417568 RepID=UPI0032909B1C
MSLELGNQKDKTTGKNNIIVSKAYDFALGIIEVYKGLKKEKEFVLSKQILRSGTSIGANVNESVAAVSKRDFVYKLGISLKEARETTYWLNLLKDSGYIDHRVFHKLNKDCDEIIKILNSIILTTKQKYLTPNS